MAREIEIKVRVSDSTKFVEFLTAEAEFVGEAHQVDEYFTPPDRDFTAVRPVNEWLRLRTSSKHSGETSGVGPGPSPEVKEEQVIASINYKYWHRDPVDGSSLYGDESESSVGDVKAMRKILTALKFRSLCTVDKVRKTWRYSVPPNTDGVILDRKPDDASGAQDRESMNSGSPTPLRSDELRRGAASVSASGSGSRMTTQKSETYEIALDREQTLGDFVEVELIGETTDDVRVVTDRMMTFLRTHGITDPNADQVGYPYLLLFGDPKHAAAA